MFCLRTFVFLGILISGTGVLPSQLFASSNNSTVSYQQLAVEFPEAVALPLHSEWLALLHYKISPTGRLDQSYVITKSYFLAENGRNDPVAELHATLTAFSTATSVSNQHPICRFPARKLWLESNTSYSFAEVNCSRFDAWAELESIDSISMVFATGHFSSPASFFGHNFLKINTINSADYLLDTAVNFGAVIPPNEGPLTYLTTGIFGGYEAHFSAEPFYRFLVKYGEEDLRDIWEYKLSLTAEQRNLLVAHLWELQEMRFQYYFFRENCAYQISALLNIVTDTAFVPRFLPWAMPVTVFDRMMSSQINGQSLVESIELHRSRRTLFQNRFSSGSAKLKRIVHRYALGHVDLANSAAYQALDESEKIRVVDTLLDYSAFMSKEKSGEVHKENQRQLLLTRIGLKNGSVQYPEADRSKPPHLGQRPSYTAIGISHTNSKKPLGFIQLRPAYYDFLGLGIGRKPHASFTLFDTQINFGESVSIGKFDLFSLSNLNTHYSGIAIDSAFSWHFRLGNEPVSDKCNDCNGWLLQWDLGKSRKLSSSMAAFALAGIAITESRNETANGALLAHIGITGKVNAYWRLFAKASYSETFNRNQPFHTLFELENRFGNSRWWDVRIKAKKRDESIMSLSAALYW